MPNPNDSGIDDSRANASRLQTIVPRLPASPVRPPSPLGGAAVQNSFPDPVDLVDAALAILGEDRQPVAPPPAAVAAPPPALPKAAAAPAAPPVPAANPGPSRAIRATVSSSGLMQEAARLAADGELGNSNAIRLLELPHTAHDLKQVLRTFDGCLTRQARAKLAREAWAPLPMGVENQRYEPIFDRYPISGKTYTTSRGAVVLNEVQYYNGEMVQLYGECSNVAAVRAALAGSGYQPLLLRYADGRETAAAQFWAHNLTDTSLLPYNAMFLIVVAVPEGAPSEVTTVRADENGATCALSMFSGNYSAETGTYTNGPRLYYHRLLDSTQVAIDVGRERMGTDKRPGMIDRARSGSSLVFSIRDGLGRPVAKIDVVLTDKPNACGAALAKAAQTAGNALPDLPPGTEYVYPSVARIGSGAAVLWDWRTDLRPRMQPVVPGMLRIEPGSDVGATLLDWGFTASILGHIPNVRGVVTGVPESGPAVPTENDPAPRVSEIPAPMQSEVQDAVTGFLAEQERSASAQHRPLRRGTHAKGICVRAIFEVASLASRHGAAFAQRLARGLFAQPGIYPATVRFANSDPRVNSDWIPDVRSLSFSIELPPGAGVAPGARRLDVSLQSAPTLPFNDLRAFAVFGRVLAARNEEAGMASLSPEDRLVYEQTKSAILQQQRQPVTPYQSLRFWSNVPFRHGADSIVKYSAAPLPGNPAGPLDGKSPDALANELRRHVNEDAVMSAFDFGVQFLDIQRMTHAGLHRDEAFWIENASVEWPEDQSPFLTVARLTLLPRQVLPESDCERRYIDVNENSLPEHSPVGSINLARAQAERASRHARLGG